MPSVERAEQLVRQYEHFLLSLSGLMYRMVDQTPRLTSKVLRQFQREANELANHSCQTLLDTLALSVRDTIIEARSAAFSDADIRTPQTLLVSQSRTTINAQVKQEYLRTSLDAVRMMRRYAAAQQLLISSGMTVGSARIRVRETHRGALLRFTRRDRLGRKITAARGLFLMLAEYLKDTELQQYLRLAARLGYRRFVIVQPGHQRDGIEFAVDAVPAAHFHPQSRAKVRLIREES